MDTLRTNRGDTLMAWFKDRIHHYAKLQGIQKEVKYYDTKTVEIHPRHLVTCMALREAGERHHDNAGGSRKLSAVAAGHTMHVKERHYEKVREDFEQVHESLGSSIRRLRGVVKNFDEYVHNGKKTEILNIA